MKKLIFYLLTSIFCAHCALAQQMLGPQLLAKTSSTATTSGTVAAGARDVEFIFSSSFTGTIDGVAWAGSTDSAKRFQAIGEHTYPAFTYTVTAGSVRIIEIR
jgi:hypothetical protein